MEKKKYDYTKIAFFTIVTLLVIIIAIAVVNNNIERSTYYELYEGVESFESVEKKYKETALELIQNDSYKYNDEQLFVRTFNSNGDNGSGYGIRYYDENGKYQKDNDIINLIPKSYFFTFIPEGKIISGDGYGYYIRTVKDLEEEQKLYNPDDHFESIVVLFQSDAFISKMYENEYNGNVSLNIIGMYFFHSYKTVKDETKFPLEIVEDIKENGVVTFQKQLENENFIFDVSKVSVRITNDTNSNLDKIVYNGAEVTEIKETSIKSLSFKILPFADENNSTYMSIESSYEIKIVDAIWNEKTSLGEINNTYIEKDSTIYSLKSSELFLNGESHNYLFYYDYPVVNYWFIGSGNTIKINISNYDTINVYFYEDGEYKSISLNDELEFISSSDIKYYIEIIGEKNTNGSINIKEK